MRRSYTSVKQNTVVEKNYQSVALAEMGVSYLQMAGKNAFDTNKSEVLDVVQNEIKKDEKNKTIWPKGYYSGLTLSTMAERIETSVRNVLEEDLKMEELTVTGAQINVNNNLFINRDGGVDYTGKGIYLDEEEFNEGAD
jgi:hypothetical protein